MQQKHCAEQWFSMWHVATPCVRSNGKQIKVQVKGVIWILAGKIIGLGLVICS